MMWRGPESGLAAVPAPAGRPRLVPPAPVPPAADLPVFPLLSTLRSNTLAAWPERAYRELVVHRRCLGTDCYLVNDPDAARAILTAPQADYGRPLGFRRLIGPVLGRGLLLAEGEEWQSQRRRIAPAFSRRNVERLMPAFAAVGSRLIARLDGASRANLSAAFQDAAIDAIGTAAFSLPFDAFAPRISRIRSLYFSRAARVSLLDCLARKEGDFLLSISLRGRLGRQAHAIIDEIIEAHRVRARAEDDPVDLIDLHLDGEGRRLPDAEIRDQIATILATGFDSTGQLMFWTIYLLAQDREEQAAVRDEIRRFPADGARTLGDLERWPRLQRALLEALRLYPPISTFMRVPRHPVELAGRTIRPGSMLTIAPWVMHRHRLLWESPQAFMPERFADGAPIHSRPGFLPFGAGQRVCIGGTFAMAEASLILAMLLESHEIALDDPRPVLPTCIVTTAPSVQPIFALRPLARRSSEAA